MYQANDVLMGYVEGHHIQPLPVEKLECYEKIDQKAWNPYTLNQSGTSYICGVPVNIQGPLLFYRKDLSLEDDEDGFERIMAELRMREKYESDRGDRL